MNNVEFRTVSHSRTTLTELMIPSYANFGGKIHGGILLSLMDKVAYAAASKHAGTYCVTVSVDRVDFRQAVEVGELVHLKARVNYVGNTSMVIGIQVTAENVKMGTVKHTNTSYFTMVAKDDDGNLVRVPELVLETRDDVRRYVEAILRKKMKLEDEKYIDQSKENFRIEDNLELLKDERCRIYTNLENRE